MKYMTMNEIKALKNLILEKTGRVESLETRLQKIHNLIPVMSDKGKAEALTEALEIKAEIAKHRKFIADANKQIAIFYAPATKVA